jgi:hypothetical protein
MNINLPFTLSVLLLTMSPAHASSKISVTVKMVNLTDQPYQLQVLFKDSGVYKEQYYSTLEESAALNILTQIKEVENTNKRLSEAKQ